MDQALDRLNADFAAAGRDAQHTGSSITLNAWLTEYLASNPQPPSLNATSPDTLSDGALVRFCGMVQDAHDPEFYDGAYDVVGADGVSRTRTTKYQGAVRDRPGEVITGRADIVWQRTPVVCVPIPSRSGWLQQRLAPQAAAAKPMGVGSPTGATKADPATVRSKRAAEEEGEAMMEEVSAASGEAAPKRATTSNNELDGGDPASAWLRSNGANSVLLKMYDQAQATEEKPDNGELKVHELVEVYGLIERASEEPINISLGEDYASICMACPMEGVEEGTPFQNHMAAMDDEERRARPPPSAQPRLHVIAVRRMTDAVNVYLPQPSTNEESLAISACRAQLPDLRTTVLSHLRTCLGGDGLAAEHVLLSTISRVLSRHGDQPIGKLPLYLTNCPPPQAGALLSPVASSLHEALSLLLPLCAIQPLTINELNSGDVAPKKDLEANCIWPAKLQLPHGATLLIDEATMSAGQLSEKGVKGMQALTSLTERQQLPYDFTYCAVDFPLDTTIIAISAASGNLLPILTKLPIRVDPNAQQAATTAPDAEWLDLARTYLGLAVRAAQHNGGGIANNPHVAKAAEDDFVKSRQADNKINADDLGRWLTCARLVAASHLETEVSIDHYEEGRRMDRMRVERLKEKAVAV